jgi:hypothetical protein
MQYRVKERLLAMRPVQVPVGQAIALADERECLPGVQVLPAGREVRARLSVVDPVAQADFHADENPREFGWPAVTTARATAANAVAAHDERLYRALAWVTCSMLHRCTTRTICTFLPRLLV